MEPLHQERIAPRRARGDVPFRGHAQTISLETDLGFDATRITRTGCQHP